jgi:type IV pilus assembly protein PilK
MADDSKYGTVTKQWSLKILPDMTSKEFSQWQSLLEKRTGMNLSPERKTFLQASLRTRMREIGCQCYDEYFDKVTKTPGGMMEWMTLVDRLTVQETRFYRDEDAFELVRSFLTSLPRVKLEQRPLEVWSVGCSTGEESYTLAMIIEQCLDSLKVNGYYAVTGTDISMPALTKARIAKYPLRKLVTLSKERREKYFNKVSADQYEVIPGLKERVCFARVNVLEIKDAPMDSMTIIFCQNLLIYFKRWRRKEILNRLAERLVPGGLLILGLGEIVDWHHPLLKRLENDKILAFIRRE